VQLTDDEIMQRPATLTRGMSTAHRIRAYQIVQQGLDMAALAAAGRGVR
jgi:hypothetical protein